MDTTSPSC